MAVLVTGGKGFLGAALIRRLVAHGETVISLDLKATPGRLADLAGRVTLLDGGIPDLAALDRLLQSYAIDRIAHLVFVRSAPENAAEIQPEIAHMVMDSTTLFEAARHAGVHRLLFPSSIAYYGPQWRHGEILLDEERPSLAHSIYGVAKNLMETVAAAYNMRAGMSIMALRIPAVYGPGGRVGARGVNLAAVECALGRPATPPYAADDSVCIAHVDDVAAALHRLLFAENPRHQLYNLGGHTLTYWQLAAIVREFLPDAQITFSESSGRSDLPYRIDGRRLRDEFAFHHRDPRDGYRDLINGVRRQAGLPDLRG